MSRHRIVLPALMTVGQALQYLPADIAAQIKYNPSFFLISNMTLGQVAGFLPASIQALLKQNPVTAGLVS
jgi:hypothetical protein